MKNPQKAIPAGGSVPASSASSDLGRRHLRFGWWSLFIFLSLGIFLESLHALKVGWYLSVSNESRRLLLTLSHAHGTLLALVNIAFAATLARVQDWQDKQRALASSCLLGATILIPAGFFLGGLKFHAGDPGIGILLLPPGALALLISVFLTARVMSKNRNISPH